MTNVLDKIIYELKDIFQDKRNALLIQWANDFSLIFLSTRFLKQHFLQASKVKPLKMRVQVRFSLSMSCSTKTSAALTSYFF